MSNIKSIDFSKYQIPLKNRFETALRSITEFDVFQLKVNLLSGETLIGEVVVTPVITQISEDTLRADVENILIPTFENFDLKDPNDFYELLQLKLPNNPTARALGDLTQYSFKNSSKSLVVKTDVTIPISQGIELEKLVKLRLEEGFNSLKIKLNQDTLSNNIEKMKILNDLTPQECAIRIDPNQSWDTIYSLEFLERTNSLGIQIEYLEQPIHRSDISGLAFIRRNTNTEIMADEACFDLKDLRKIIDLEAADWVNIKILKAGGVTPAKKLAEEVLRNNLKLSFGCMIESPIGVGAAMSLAHQYAPNQTHDLDAAWWYFQKELNYESGSIS